MKKYSIEKLTMAQISADSMDSELLNELEQRTSYKDTDASLDESIVSVDTLLNIVSEYEDINASLAKEAIELWEQVKDFNYIQIAKI